MKSKILSLILIFCYSTAAFAQNSWPAVQTLKTNENLVIKKKDGHEVKGAMIEASDSILTIDQKGKPLSIPRADIQQISVVKGKASKGKWAAIGAGIGAGTGAAIGATQYSADHDDSQIYIGMGFLIGTGVGAASGLLFGHSRRQRDIVYTAN